MKVILEIPKEFECDYNKDKFRDYFMRVASDIPALTDRYVDEYSMCGNYEKETHEMLMKAFQESEKQ